MQQLFGRYSLRSSLLLDAAFCAIAGLLMLVAAPQFGDLFNLPEELLRGIGIFPIPYVAFLAIIATRDPISPVAAWTVIVINLIWTAASFILLLSGQVDPNTVGVAFVIVQALVVALFAEVEFVGLGFGTTGTGSGSGGGRQRDRQHA